MAGKEQRFSYCLKHQDIVTDTRCGACLKPICEQCTVTSDRGKFCSQECYEKRVASDERVERLRQEEEADKFPRLIRKLINLAILVLLVVAAFALYPKLPASVRQPVDSFFKSLHTTKK